MKKRLWAVLVLAFVAACGRHGSVLPPAGRSTAALSTASYIDYVLVAHPDDEIEGWAGFQHDPQAYPVFVMLTRGQHTAFCDTASYNRGWQPQYNELPASPVPTLSGTETCAQARVNSYMAYMDDMASVDPQHDDVIGAAAPISGNAPALPANCYAESTRYWLWAGAHHARLILDIGDGHVQPCAVTWALGVARSMRSLLPVKAEMNAIGDSFYGTPSTCSGSPTYDHPDHLAIYTAMRTLNLGLPGDQYQLVCQTDGASVGYILPASIQTFAWPSITGATERHYGWLTVESSPPPAYCCYPFQYLPKEWFAVTPSSGVTPPPGNYASTVLSYHPTQYFKLNESAGPTAYDSSTTASNGTYVGAVTFGAPGPLLNEPSTAISLPGAGANLGVSLPSPNAGTGKSYTIETWVYPMPASDYTTIWGYDGRHRLLLAANGQLLSQFSGNFFSKRTLSTGKWHDVVFVYDAQTAAQTYYIDGVADNSAPLASTYASFTSPYYLGQYNTGTFYKWKGRLAQHVFYPSALSAAQVANLYAAAGYAGSPYSTTVLSDNPSQYFKLNEAAGPIAYDSSPSAINGTYVGAVTYGVLGPLLHESSTAISLPGATASAGVSLPNPNASSGTSYSIETWVYPLASSDYMTIWGYDGTHRLLLSSSGRLLSQFAGNFSSQRTLAAGQWHDVVFVYNAGTATQTYYLDGTADASASLSPSYAAFTSPYYLGQYNTGTFYKWRGALAQHAFFRSALTASQVANLYQSAQ